MRYRKYGVEMIIPHGAAFDALAERVLHSLIQGPKSLITNPAETAIKIATDFTLHLDSRKSAGLTSGLTDAEIVAVKDSRLILAIKLLRDRTGMNLADAKKFIASHTA